jgi:hypothetical protein
MQSFRKAIESVNVIISTYNDKVMGDIQVLPEKVIIHRYHSPVITSVSSSHLPSSCNRHCHYRDHSMGFVVLMSWLIRELWDLEVDFNNGVSLLANLPHFMPPSSEFPRRSS